MKAIINGNIILKDRVLAGKALLFDHKIQGIFDAADIPEGTEIIDAAGQFIAPGLIDIHIHGYLGEDVSDGKPEGIQKMAEGLVKNGVTGFLPTTVTIPREELLRVAEIVRGLKEKSLAWNGTAILGMHAEGPYVNPKKKGAQNEAFIQRPDAALIIENSDIIRLVTLAPEMDEDFHAVREIAANSDVVISMGHTDANYNQACDSVLAGVRHATHLFNAMTPLAHRDPGVVGAAFNTPVSVELICDKFHIHPAMFDIVYKLKKDKLVLITDCLRSGGLADGEYSLGGQKVILKGIECRLEDGTIAGSVLTLNKAVLNFWQNADVSVWDAVNAASLSPAAVLGLQGQKGSLEVGKDADIILADEEFNVSATVIGGEIKFQR